MNDIDINLYYNRYRLEALERVLHSQGKSIEDAVYPMLDSLICASWRTDSGVRPAVQ